ncbi:MAG: DUF1127 domain-containing protein [Loktanella sp.]|nr:DUF1127 domain-containing protein [Loktanella sp.]
MMPIQSQCPPAALSRSPARTRLLALVWQAFALARQRRALRNLAPEQLRDIGLTAQQAADEAAKPVWDVPRHWRM